MKKNYILIFLLCFLLKNIIEYKYNGPSDVGFGTKWKTVLNAGTKNIDNVLENSLVDVESKKANNRQINEYADKTLDYTSPAIPLKDKENSSTSSNYQSIPQVNDITDNYAVTDGGSTSLERALQPTQNSNNGISNYSNNNTFLASNGIYNGHGPSDFGVTDVAINGNNNGPQWGGNEVGLTGLPGTITPPDDNQVPIDGGLSILFAAAIGKGIKSLRTNKRVKVNKACTA